jgi:hypothetical protein
VIVNDVGAFASTRSDMIRRHMSLGVMWRFLLAGLLTVGGLILLFIGSLGDPARTMRDLRSVFAAGQPSIMPSPIESPPAMVRADQASTAAPVVVPPSHSPAQSPFGNATEPAVGAIPVPQSAPAENTVRGSSQNGNAGLHQTNRRRRSSHPQGVTSRSAARHAGKPAARPAGAGVSKPRAPVSRGQ